MGKVGESSTGKLMLSPRDGFKQHLITNKHIFLSGRYGIGKTTFIRDFFDSNTDAYISIHLFPVNYSVADNRDVFELIKTDILYSLLDYIDPKDLASNDSIYKTPLAGFIAENFDSIFLGFLKLAGGLGKKIYEIAEELKVLKEEYEKHKKTNESSLKEHIEIFGEKYKDQIGHLYENDAFTELIQSLLEYLRESTGKELVLIIDDLDRIDPDHIFRILNIFSSHFDRSMTTSESSNKFDFDKIILIADYYNLKSIYKHKYGLKTDFSGYIDKFYSTYRYDLTYVDATIQYLETHYSDVQLQNSDHYKVINFLLSILFKNGRINFRMLEKNSVRFLDNRIGGALSVYELLFHFINDKDGFKEKLQNLNCEAEDIYEFNNYGRYNIRLLTNEFYNKFPNKFTKDLNSRTASISHADFTIHGSIDGPRGYNFKPTDDDLDNLSFENYLCLIIFYFEQL